MIGPTRRSRVAQLPFQAALPYVLAGLVALMAADLATVSIRSMMIPTAAPPAKPQSYVPGQTKIKADYNEILTRNIFNSDGVIPDLQTPENPDINLNIARESTLPLQLIGTIVHVNPGKSVAAIQANGNAEKSLAYTPNQDIPDDGSPPLATLLKVERKKIFIRNLQSRAVEYVQIKDDSALAFKTKSVTYDGPVAKEGENVFAISRSDLDAQKANLPELLTQARAIAHYDASGKIDCFKIVELQDGSLFSKLGIHKDDCIKSVDGQQIDSPAKAMELYNALSSQSQVHITVDRNGRPQTMTYNIR